MADEVLLELTADIVTSHVAHNNVPVSDLPALIKSVHAALQGLGTPVAEPEPELKPAVSIRSSIKPDHIVSLESGKKMKMLKRYLQTNYGMTPDDYRKKWSLPADYPMVAPNYAEQRKALAVKIGLGRKPAAATPPLAAAPMAAPAKIKTTATKPATVKAVPAKAVAAKTAPAKPAVAKPAPAKTAPVKDAANGVPKKAAPVKTNAANDASGKAPSKAAASKAVPKKAAPAKATAAKDAPTQVAPKKASPAKSRSKNTPA